MTLERRVEALEDSFGGGGCDRCQGVLIVVRDAVTGKLVSARLNRKPITKEDVEERESELRCPRCGRKIDHTTIPVVNIGDIGDFSEAGGRGH